MSDAPNTIRSSETTDHGFEWDDNAELHKGKDSGGLLHGFKAIRHGTVAELIALVMDMPEDTQAEYSIEKQGDHTLDIVEIRALYARQDFPKR